MIEEVKRDMTNKFHILKGQRILHMMILPQPCHQASQHLPACHALTSLPCEVFLPLGSHQVSPGVLQSVYQQTCFPKHYK